MQPNNPQIGQFGGIITGLTSLFTAMGTVVGPLAPLTSLLGGIFNLATGFIAPTGPSGEITNTEYLSQDTTRWVGVPPRGSLSRVGMRVTCKNTKSANPMMVGVHLLWITPKGERLEETSGAAVELAAGAQRAFEFSRAVTQKGDYTASARMLGGPEDAAGMGGLVGNIVDFVSGFLVRASFTISLESPPAGASYWFPSFGADYYATGWLDVSQSWDAPYSIGTMAGTFSLAVRDADGNTLHSNSLTATLEDGKSYRYNCNTGQLSEVGGITDTRFPWDETLGNITSAASNLIEEGAGFTVLDSTPQRLVGTNTKAEIPWTAIGIGVAAAAGAYLLSKRKPARRRALPEPRRFY